MQAARCDAAGVKQEWYLDDFNRAQRLPQFSMQAASMCDAAGGKQEWYLDDFIRAQGYDLIAALIDTDVSDGCSVALQDMHLSTHQQ